MKKHVILAAAWAVIFSSVVSRAAEPWADPQMPVSKGLELWLDASHATGKDPPSPDHKLNVWRDASGNKRDLRQPNPAAEPVFFPVGGNAIVRFDGIDDCLRALHVGAKLDSFTTVIIGAPRRNAGNFAALMALNAANERDYTSGLNIDLGPAATNQFSVLNVEGRGFGGQRNLRTHESIFARLHTLVISSDVKEKTVSLMVDGQAEGQRPRDPAPISMDEITVGARFYNNGAGAQHVNSFGRTDIAEFLIYSRKLDAAELTKLRK